MIELFNNYIYSPLFSVLVFIYHTLSFNDLGFAIIILTVLIRIVLYPLFHKSAKSQSIMQRLQPHIKKIQEAHKDNRETQASALLALYRSHKVNPFSGFLFILIQLPIFIALFQLFSKGLTGGTFDNTTLFGLISLGEPSLPLAFIAAALQYIQTKLVMGKTKEGEAQQKAGKFMLFFGPALTLIVLINLPSALGLYWSVSNLISIGQQALINKKLSEQGIEVGN